MLLCTDQSMAEHKPKKQRVTKEVSDEFTPQHNTQRQQVKQDVYDNDTGEEDVVVQTKKKRGAPKSRS